MCCLKYDGYFFRLKLGRMLEDGRMVVADVYAEGLDREVSANLLVSTVGIQD